MIKKMQKMLFLGARSDLEAFLSAAQKLGVLEFVPKPMPAMAVPREVTTLMQALKVLRAQRASSSSNLVEVGQEPLAASPLECAQTILKLHDQLEMLRAERGRWELCMRQAEPFGHFSTTELTDFLQEAQWCCRFFQAKPLKKLPADFSSDLLFVSENLENSYWIFLGETRREFAHVKELFLELSMDEAQDKIKAADLQIARLKQELNQCCSLECWLKASLFSFWDTFALQGVKRGCHVCLDSQLFYITAWIPLDQKVAVANLITTFAIVAEESAVDPDEVVPTCLANEGFSRLGQDLVSIYDPPAAGDMDPSLWVFCFFTLFFAMIIADAGYGLIFLALTLWVHFKKKPATKSGKRFVKLSFILSTACIVWGVITASVFSLKTDPEGWLNKPSVVRFLAEKTADYMVLEHTVAWQELVKKIPAAKNAQTGKALLESAVEIDAQGVKEHLLFSMLSKNILLEISLLLGVIHLCFALLRFIPRQWAGAGWVLFLWGGYLYFPVSMNATSLMHVLHLVSPVTASILGFRWMLIGLSTAIFLGILQKRFRGLEEVSRGIQLFADVLSYLRLYALGLAGLLMGDTFNSLGQQAGWACGWLIVLLGHLLNITLALMGGVIHGLRLNFIEWYHYCFEGGGRLFRPLVCLDPLEDEI